MDIITGLKVSTRDSRLLTKLSPVGHGKAVAQVALAPGCLGEIQIDIFSCELIEKLDGRRVSHVEGDIS